MNLKEKRAAGIQRMKDLAAVDEMTPEQIVEFDRTADELRTLDDQIAQMEKRQNQAAALVSQNNQRASQPERGVPGMLRYERGDNEATAWKAFFAHGDSSGLRHLRGEDEQGKAAIVLSLPSLAESRGGLMGRESRAVVDSTMNITTAGDGGNLVPTGFAGTVALRKNERMLAPRLGCRLIPGVGTTVNYPYESADPEVFATTSEQADNHGNSYERGAVATGVKAFTLVKKSRKVELTEELLEDNAVNVQAYVADRISREMAKTHNAMLVAEVAANGTALGSFAGTAAVAAGEPEEILGNDALGYYLEDGANAAWVMRSSTHWAIKSITGNPRLYSGMESDLLGYPVLYSNGVAALGTSAKSVLFGAWDYMGYREAPEIRFISDPYSVDGLVVLKYSFRAVYGILQGAAIGYGANAAS